MRSGACSSTSSSRAKGVKIVGNQVQVSGQVAVMDINGLLTKVIFDHNPKNEFFVEESFPLDWMYPYLTPFGIIMKINRNPLPSLTQDVLDRDHQFWKQYSKRMTGDIIDYDTPVKQMTDWIEKTYVRHDFNGFTGRPQVRAGRRRRRSPFPSCAVPLAASMPGGSTRRFPREYRPKTAAERERLLREADFRSCRPSRSVPYSPEAVFRYSQLLLQLQRVDDAILVAETCLVLDPYNGQVAGLLDNLKSIKASQAHYDDARKNLRAMEDQVRTNPAALQVAFDLAGTYLQMQDTDRQCRSSAASPKPLRPSSQAVLSIAKLFNQMQNWPRLEVALERLVKLDPSTPRAGTTWRPSKPTSANLPTRWRPSRRPSN